LAQDGFVRGRHFGERAVAGGVHRNLLDERGAVEAVAGGFPLRFVALVERVVGFGDGELGLRFLFFRALEESEILEDAFERSFGGGFVAVEEG
jgi:hypothetical protein